MLLERALDAHRVLAQLRASKPPRLGSGITLAGGHRASVAGRSGEFWEIRFEDDALAVFEQAGEIPLAAVPAPASRGDRSRALPDGVCARVPGAVAAPTAGLHFDEALLERCAAAGIADRSPDAARRRGHVPARARRRPRRTPHARGADAASRPSSALRSRRRATAAAGSSPSARPACVHSSRPRRAARSSPARARRGSSSGPAIGFASSTRC